MKIQKLGHSCLLIEERDKRLLIDPGTFAFAPLVHREPEAIGPVDAILVTHEHPDHFAPEVIKRICALRPATVGSHRRIAELCRGAGISCNTIEANTTRTLSGFEVAAVHAPHEKVLGPSPENTGFFINRTLFHPGDSFSFELTAAPRVLALPITAPWLTAPWAVEISRRIKPQIVIPIHDGFIKDFFLAVLYKRYAEALAADGIAFRPLGADEWLEA